jgi:hypothetical protein
MKATKRGKWLELPSRWHSNPTLKPALRDYTRSVIKDITGHFEVYRD